MEGDKPNDPELIKKKVRKKNKIPIRKRHKHVKRHITTSKTSQQSTAKIRETSISPVNSGEVGHEVLQNFQPLSVSIPSDLFESGSSCSSSDVSVSSSLFSPPIFSPGSSDASMDISRPDSSASNGSFKTPEPPDQTSTILSTPSTSTTELPEDPTVTLDYETSKRLLFQAKQKLEGMLPKLWVPLVDNGGIHVLMVGRLQSKAVQRDVFCDVSGGISIEVHGQDFSSSAELLKGTLRSRPLSSEWLNYFVDRLVQIVNKLRLLEICSGVALEEYKEVWSSTANGYIDKNNYKECRYSETFRSNQCSLLIDCGKWRCGACSKMIPFLKRKLLMSSADPHANTSNKYLSKDQALNKLAALHKAVRSVTQLNARLEARMAVLIEKESVKVDENLSEALTEILRSADLTPMQSLFWQQQIKASQSKRSCGMRWHPAMIRLALSIHLKSPAAYRKLRESGAIQLPCARTLFEYSHASKREFGIDKSVVEKVAERANREHHKHKQFFVLMADEMHISKNIVIQKSTGDIIGFTDLDDVDKEVALMEAFLDDPEKKVEETVASKMMVYMVKGISNNIKEVVASYPVHTCSANQMYIWTWDVIGTLERNNCPVIAFTADAGTTNRAFFKLHQPATKVPSGIIFDTVNKAAPERILYFFSDVPHLMKTIRNGFFNSRRKKKGTRTLKRNGQLIVWEHIIRLYLEKRKKTFRKSYKLNAQNVFPDSFTRMKVKYAAQVMSNTVATDLQSQNWEKTEETVNFIRRVNNWFDLLNGAHTNQGNRKNNKRLNAYTIEDVKNQERFCELLEFLDYLHEWKQEADREYNTFQNTAANESGIEPLPEEEQSFHPLDTTGEENDMTSSQRCLPHQTLLGIEMSTRSFIAASTYLLTEVGLDFVNARVFCQDPLELNFCKQRQAGGSKTNPNALQFINQQGNINVQAELSDFRTSAGNVGDVDSELQLEISDEPLPKRKRRK